MGKVGISRLDVAMRRNGDTELYFWGELNWVFFSVCCCVVSVMKIRTKKFLSRVAYVENTENVRLRFY